MTAASSRGQKRSGSYTVIILTLFGIGILLSCFQIQQQLSLHHEESSSSSSMVDAAAAVYADGAAPMTRDNNPVEDRENKNWPMWLHAAWQEYHRQQQQHSISSSNYSFVVELEHCDFGEDSNDNNSSVIMTTTTIDWNYFWNWTIPILDKAEEKAAAAAAKTNKQKKKTTLSNNSATTQTRRNWRREWTLQLLEMYAVHSGRCDFGTKSYRRQVPGDVEDPSTTVTTARMESGGKQLQHIVETVPAPTGQARIAFVIIAYHDAPQLQRLIEAIHLPHHLIVIHLEAAAQGSDYELQVRDMVAAGRYENVVVRCFGSVLYETDSISQIQLQMMQWMVIDLELQYNYHVTLGGAVYPLWGATELARHLYSSGGNVWMGELTHNGMRLNGHPQWGFFWKKRLLLSQEKITVKAGFIIPKEFPSSSSSSSNNDTAPSSTAGQEYEIPTWIDQALQHKATSGNQAIYSYQVVRELLHSRQVQHLFALAKYGCCCCVEERSWIGAMHLLGYLEEAKRRRSMFQFWGGFPPGECRGSMGNAILDESPQRCFRSEDPSRPEVYVWGNETWSELVRAKREEGVLFARKFQSDHAGSMALLDRIRMELHEQS